MKLLDDAEIVMLIGYLHHLPQRAMHVPGRGDPEHVDEYRAILTDAQRHTVIEALRRYNP